MKTVIDAYDFTNVRTINIDGMMSDTAVKRLLIEKYGGDRGKYPAAVPVDVQDVEMRQIDELVEAYEHFKVPRGFGRCIRAPIVATAIQVFVVLRS